MMLRRSLLTAAMIVVAPVLNLAVAQMTESSQRFREAHEKMMKDMMMAPTGDADRDFVTMMIPHHQGAIDMAKIELKYGKDPGLKEMAQKIIDAQEKEIEEFRKWLSEHNS
jgi:uncharacterized protein (DUF305 family)